MRQHNGIRLILFGAIAVLAFLLANSAFAQTPAPYVPQVPPRVDITSALGVSFANGSFNYSKKDLDIGSGDIGMSLTRSYSTGQTGTDPELPVGWDHNFNIHITEGTLQNPATFIANSLRPYRPGYWPYIYNVIIGNRSVPFLSNNGSNTPTGGFVGTYIPARSDGETLTYAGDEQTGHFTFTDSDGTIVYFGSRTEPDSANPHAAPLRAIYEIKPDGTRYDFYYSSGALIGVVSNNGYEILINGGEAHTVCAVSLSRNYAPPGSTCPSGAMAVHYSYGAQGTYYGGPLLTAAQDVLGNTETYSYGQYDHMTCLKRSGESGCRIANTYYTCTLPMTLTVDPGGIHAKDVVSSQRSGTGQIYTYHIVAPQTGTFYCPIVTSVNQMPPAGGSMINPDGSTRTYNFTPSTNDALPGSVVDELNRTSTYTYTHGNGQGLYMGDLVTSETKPSGLKLAYTYDNRGNLTSATQISTDGSSLNESYTYPSTCAVPATCNKITSLRDWNGNETDWTYTPYGKVASEMLPAPTSGAARPLKLYTYVQMSANVLNPSGALVSTGSPIWMPSTLTECQTVAGSSTTTCDANAPKVVTTYQYGAAGSVDNLLLHGKSEASDGKTLVTCYGHDQFGHVVSETSPNANLGVCP